MAIAKQLLIAGVPFAAFLTMLFVNSFVRWSVREWYFAWGIPTLALLLGVTFNYLGAVVSDLAARLRPRVSAFGAHFAVYGVLVGLTAVPFFEHAQETWRIGYHIIQGDNYAAGRFLKEQTDPDARAAAFNAGVVGYFSERTVINLDGVVNTDAYHAMQDHRLLAYVRSANVEYIADRDGAWTNLAAFIRSDDWSESLWGADPNAAMTSVLELPAPGNFPRMNVWRLEPGGGEP